MCLALFGLIGVLSHINVAFITEREVDKVHLERDRLQKSIQTFGSLNRSHWRSPESHPNEELDSRDEKHQQRMERQLEQEVERVKSRSRARAALSLDKNECGSDAESL